MSSLKNAPMGSCLNENLARSGTEPLVPKPLLFDPHHNGHDEITDRLGPTLALHMNESGETVRVSGSDTTIPNNEEGDR